VIESNAPWTASLRLMRAPNFVKITWRVTLSLLLDRQRAGETAHRTATENLGPRKGVLNHLWTNKILAGCRPTWNMSAGTKLKHVVTLYQIYRYCGARELTKITKSIKQNHLKILIYLSTTAVLVWLKQINLKYMKIIHPINNG
jgi:hypothetical protein